MSQTQPKDITVILPDGAKLSIPLGSTISNVAYEIGPGLGKAAVAGIINDELVDLYTPVSDNDQISICLLYTSPSPRDLSTYRMPSSA